MPNSVVDIDLMQHADGELDDRETAEIGAAIGGDPNARAKVQAIGQVGEIVRSHLELAADDVPARRFDAIWREVDKQTAPEAVPAAEIGRIGVWAAITGWLDRHRGHLITGLVSAGAVAAVALMVRPAHDGGVTIQSSGAIDVRPVALRAPPEIESLDTPGGSGTVINLEDEDGHTAVIWVTPEDTVEGI